MLFLLQLLLSVSEGAAISVRTLLVLKPSLAQLGLDFEFVVLAHDAAVVLEGKRVEFLRGMVSRLVLSNWLRGRSLLKSFALVKLGIILNFYEFSSFPHCNL